jgi:hypothetical protein
MHFLRDASMRPPRESDSSFEEILENKRMNRERLIRFIEEAAPEIVAADAERLREAMQKPEGEPRRRRYGPPAFCK